MYPFEYQNNETLTKTNKNTRYFFLYLLYYEYLHIENTMNKSGISGKSHRKALIQNMRSLRTIKKNFKNRTFVHAIKYLPKGV